MVKLKLAELYSQQDEPWVSKLLCFNTEKQYTIKNYGCMITTVDVFLCALGIKVNPLELNEILKNIGGYQNFGMFVFDSLKKKWPEIQMEYVSDKWSGPVPQKDIDKMYELLDQGKYLVTEVDFYPNTVMEDMHWVGVIGYDDRKQFLIFDPWSGKVVPLSVYGDPKRVIYCYRTYNKTLPFEGTAGQVSELEHNSEQWGKTVDKYKTGSLPKDTQFEDIERVVAGYISRATDLQNQLSTALAEVTNRTEQVSRLKDQLLQEGKLREDLTGQLKKALGSQAEVAGVYEGQLKGKQAVIDQMGKDKGELTTKVANLETSLQSCKTEATKTLTVAEVFVLLLNKIIRKK